MQMSRLYVQVTQVSRFLTRYIFEAKKKMDYNILSKFRESPLFNATKMHYLSAKENRAHVKTVQNSLFN